MGHALNKRVTRCCIHEFVSLSLINLKHLDVFVYKVVALASSMRFCWIYA